MAARRRATSLAGSTSRSRRATRILSMPRCSRSRPTPMGQCGSAPGCQLGACRDHRRRHARGRSWPGSPGASLNGCGPAIIRRTGTTRPLRSTRTIPTASFSTLSTSGSRPHGILVQRHHLRLQRHERPCRARRPARARFRAWLLQHSAGGQRRRRSRTTNADIAAGRSDLVQHGRGLNTIEFYSGDISGNFANRGARRRTAARRTTAPCRYLRRNPDRPGAVADGRWRRWFLRAHRSCRDRRARAFASSQGNNSGGLSRCVTNCTAAAARPGHSSVRGSWTGDTQSFILPFDLFHGGIPGGDDCAPAGVPGGCGHLIAGTTRVWETIAGGNATMYAASWYVTNNPTTQNMTKQTLGNRSFINQIKYSPKYQSVAMSAPTTATSGSDSTSAPARRRRRTGST